MPEGVLRFWTIDKRVGQVSNGEPELLEPLSEAGVEAPTESNLL